MGSGAGSCLVPRFWARLPARLARARCLCCEAQSGPAVVFMLFPPARLPRFYTEAMPKILDDFQHLETVRIHLLKANMKKVREASGVERRGGGVRVF